MRILELPGLLLLGLAVSYGWMQPHRLAPVWAFFPLGVAIALLGIVRMRAIPPLVLAICLFALALLTRALAGEIAASIGIRVEAVATDEFLGRYERRLPAFAATFYWGAAFIAVCCLHPGGCEALRRWRKPTSGAE